MRLALPMVGTLILLVVAALAGDFATSSMLAGVSRDADNTQEAPSQEASTNRRADRPSPNSAEYYSVITERPLFAPNRRPNGQLATEPVRETPRRIATSEREIRRPDIVILGVVGAGENSAALLSVDGETSAWVRKGEPIKDWVLSDLGSDWIEIGHAKKAVRLDMYTQ